MTISNEAVEAAANAISECSGMRFDGFWSRVEDLEPEDREYALMEARAALEAAAPYLMAQALEDAADAWQVRMDTIGRGTVEAKTFMQRRAVAERGGQ